MFRADASARMGTGHVMRCLMLAEALAGRGAHASFVCREHEGHLIGALRAKSLTVAALPAPLAASEARDGYAGWLGVPQAEDAAQTIDALHGSVPDWLVVDHYALGAEWERRLRPHARRLLVIDDLADRAHDCDALLDQNYAEEGGRRHEGLVPPGCRVLAGPRYALLAPEYASQRREQPARDGAVRRVLVYFGGSDPDNLSGEALAALAAADLGHLAVDLVIGTNHRHRAALEAQAAKRPATCVYGTRPHLADLMARADLAIGAGGVSTWERMCLGLPSLVVSLAENQRPTCEALAAAGLIAYLGHAGSIGSDQIHDAVKTLSEDRDRLARLTAGGQRLVDGRGAVRVVDAMLGNAEDTLQVRDELHDGGVSPEGFDTFRFAWIDRCAAEQVLALRNQPHVTAQMRSREPITAADHRAFLEAYPRLDRYDFVLIDEARGRCVGVFYVTNLRSTPEIGKYVGDPDYLGQGVGRRATERLLEFCRTSAGLRRLVATTRRDNARNIALNERLGFRQTDADGDYVVMTLNL